jgi:nucleoside-diphosphate-sugar epimerase
MRVFMTGASGWIGSAVVPQLIAAGHEVVGLARSDDAAAALTVAGAEVRRGSLDDLDSLRAGAQSSDGVIHLAFKHDFSDFAGAGRTERAAIETIGNALEGSGRPFLFASGVALAAPGRVATERDVSPMSGPDSPRGGSEVAPEDAAEHFGWIATFFALDVPASSALTQELLGWSPTHPGLMEDLEAGHYFRTASA